MNWTKLDYLLLFLLCLGCTSITIILAYSIPLNNPLNKLILGWLGWMSMATFITLLSFTTSEETKSRIFSNLQLSLNVIGYVIGFMLYPLVVALLLFSFVIGLFTGNGDSLDIPSPFDMGERLIFLSLVIFGTIIPMPFIVGRLNRLGISITFSMAIFLATVLLGVVFGILIKFLILESVYGD